MIKGVLASIPFQPVILSSSLSCFHSFPTIHFILFPFLLPFLQITPFLSSSLSCFYSFPTIHFILLPFLLPFLQTTPFLSSSLSCFHSFQTIHFILCTFVLPFLSNHSLYPLPILAAFFPNTSFIPVLLPFLSSYSHYPLPMHACFHSFQTHFFYPFPCLASILF